MPHRPPPTHDVQAQIERLESHQYTQRNAVRALARTVGPENTEALPALRNTMARTRTRPYSHIFEDAVAAVASIGTDEAIEILQTDWEHQKTCTTAKTALAKAAAVLSTSQTQIPPFLNTALDHEEKVVRSTAAHSLGAVAGANRSDTNRPIQSPPAIDSVTVRERLVAILQDGDEHWIVRRNAARGLARLGDDKAAPVLRTLLDDRESRDSRPETSSQPPTTFQDFLNNNRHDPVRVAAVDALGYLGDQRDINRLATLLQDETVSGRVRRAAAEALERLGGSAIEPLLAFVKICVGDHSLGELGKIAVRALGAFDGERVYETLLEVIRKGDHHDGMVAGATMLLGDIGDERDIPLLEEFVVYPTADASSGSRIYDGTEAATNATRSLASLRFEADPTEAIEHVDTYHDEYYEERLVEHITNHAAEYGTLDLVWRLVDSDIKGSNAVSLIRGTLKHHEAFRWDDIAEFTLWRLENPNGTRMGRVRELRVLLDGLGRPILDRLVATRRTATRTAVLDCFDPQLRMADWYLDLLAVFGADDVVTEVLRDVVRDKDSDIAAKALQTLDEVGAETVQDLACEVLTENRETPVLETAAIDVLHSSRDTALGPWLSDRFQEEQDPDHVGTLAARLLALVYAFEETDGAQAASRIEETTAYELLLEKLEDTSFYAAMDAAYDGYDVTQPASGRDDPRRLPAHLLTIDRERAIEDLTSVVRTSESSGRRVDALQTLRTYGADDPTLFERCLDDSHPDVRFVAGRALAQDDHSRAVELLHSVIGDFKASPRKRRVGVRLLGEIGSDAAVHALADAVRKRPDSIPAAREHRTIQAMTVETLAGIESPQATDALDRIAAWDDELATAVQHAQTNG